MFIIKRLTLFVLILVLGGCAIIRDFEGIMTLKRYNASQVELQRYVDRQTKLFDRLVSDIKADKLDKGTTEARIVRMYGDPIFVKNIDDGSPAKEKLLFRHPMNYFTSDKVYMYFDENKKLLYWKYVPYVEKKD